jgi:hypothetical protein
MELLLLGGITADGQRLLSADAMMQYIDIDIQKPIPGATQFRGQY